MDFIENDAKITVKLSWSFKYLSLGAQTSPSSRVCTASAWVKFQRLYSKIERAMTFCMLNCSAGVSVDGVMTLFLQYVFCCMYGPQRGTGPQTVFVLKLTLKALLFVKATF